MPIEKRYHLLVVYFCPLPTTSAPEGAVVRLAASAEAANAIRTLNTFMLTIVERPACTVVQRKLKKERMKEERMKERCSELSSVEN